MAITTKCIAVESIMAYPAEVTFTWGLMTFFVTMVCVRLVLPLEIFQHVSWLAGKTGPSPHRRKAARLSLAGVTAHVSDGNGYWRGTLVDASARGFCLDLRDAEGFSASQGMFGLPLEKEGVCLPVRVELKWKRELPGRMSLGLAVEDHHWSWQKFQDTICRIAPASTREV
jgi:hypothetical protein